MISREKRIEVFGEEYVEHTEWWTDQLDLVEIVLDDILTVIDEREDARVARRGIETDQSGQHRLTLTVDIAGEPWESKTDE